MARFGAAVAADVDVVAFVRGDESEAGGVLLVYIYKSGEENNSLLVLRLRTLPDTPRHRRLELMRRPNTLIPILQPNRQARTIPHAKAAPRRPHTRLNRPQTLRIRMATLHPGSNQLRPDLHQILLPRAKHIDPLPPGNLTVQPEPLRHVPDDDEFVGGDLAPRDAGDDGEGPVALDVAEVLVVGVLQVCVRGGEDVVVVQRREDACQSGLADFAAEGGGVFADGGHDFGEGGVFLDGDDVEEVDAGVGKVRAY